MSTAFRWLGSWWSRLTAGIALTAVATATGVISYRHIYELSIVLYQPPLVARLMPVGIDGLIVIGSVVLLQATPDHPYLGWFGVAPGIAVSVFANIESGIPHGWLAATWAGVPAAGFALATFLLERWLKSQVSHPAGVARSGSAPDPLNFEQQADAPVAVYHLYDAGNLLLNIGTTSAPEQTFKQRAEDTPWWGEVAGKALQWYPGRAEAVMAGFAAISRDRPKYNKAVVLDGILPNEVPATSSQCPHGVAQGAEEAVTTAFLHGRDCIRDVPSQRQLAAAFGVSRPRVAELVGSLNGSGPRNEGEPGNE